MTSRGGIKKNKKICKKKKTANLGGGGANIDNFFLKKNNESIQGKPIIVQLNCTIIVKYYSEIPSWGGGGVHHMAISPYF